jgi:hypothetical protein
VEPSGDQFDDLSSRDRLPQTRTLSAAMVPAK